MAFFNVKLRVEYTVQVGVEAPSADEAMKSAARDAAARIEGSFFDEDLGLSAVGESQALSAVCVTEFA